MSDEEKIAIIKKWLNRKGLQLLETVTQAGQEKCETKECVVHSIQPQYNKTIKSLKFHKLARHSNENAEEWMDRLRIATTECNYKEMDRQLKQNNLYTGGMMMT